MDPLRFALILLLSAPLTFLHATHMRSGEIQVNQITKNGLQVRITITVFTNTINTNVLFGGEDDWLDFGDGTKMLVPETANTIRADLGNGIAMASFTVLHTYPAYGKFLVSYSEPNRNEGVLNMDGSVNTKFYIESAITLEPDIYYYSPYSLLAPVYHAVMGTELTLSLAHSDSNGYRLLYEKVTPQREREAHVVNYKFPENYSIHPLTGLLTWDTKFNQMYMEGEYAFAVKIHQVAPDGTLKGYVLRDFQIILTQGNGIALDDDKDLDENSRIYVSTGGEYSLNIVARAAASASVTLLAFSDVPVNAGAIELSVYDSVSSSGAPLKAGRLKLRNTAAIERDTPYAITVRAKFTTDGMVSIKDIVYLFFTKDLPSEVPVDIPPTGFVVANETDILRSNAVYPNPFTNILYFDSRLANRHYLLSDINGRVVYRGQAIDKEIDLTHISPGLYFITIKDQSKFTRIKIIKR